MSWAFERHGWAALVLLNWLLSATAMLAGVALLERRWPERPAWRHVPTGGPVAVGRQAPGALGRHSPPRREGRWRGACCGRVG